MKNRLSLQDKAELPMKSAIRKLIAEHKRTGRPLALWKNGRAVLIPPTNFKGNRALSPINSQGAPASDKAEEDFLKNFNFGQ